MVAVAPPLIMVILNRFLPVMELSGDESPSDFSARVKQSLASSLNLVVSEITEDDVKKLLTGKN